MVIRLIQSPRRFFKRKKHNQKDRMAVSSPKQRDTNSFLTFSFFYAHHLTHLSIILYQKKSYSNHFLVNISQNQGILSVELLNPFNIRVIRNLELH